MKSDGDLPISTTVESGANRTVAARIAAINLNRAWWIVLTTTSLSAGLLVYSEFENLHSSISLIQWIDIIGSCMFLGMIALARANRIPASFANPIVYTYAAFFVLLLDGYFFTALPRFSGNVSYFFGVLTPSVLILLRPRFWIPFLLANHAVYIGILATADLDSREYFSLAAGGTAVTLLACLVNGFLYRSKFADLLKEALIARRNRELAAINASLESRTAEIEELMAIAAHDLRSPLHSLKSLYELEGSHPEWQREPYRGLLDASIKSCAEMLALVNGILDAHQADHTLQNATPTPTDVTPLFRRSAENAHLAASGKDIRIKTILPDGPTEAVVVPEHLQHVLDNLLSNAIKFSPQNSVVELALYRNSSDWVGEVRDEGPGIPPEDQTNLFQKFQRGVNRPTGGESSSGFGLFIAHKMMRSMGGTLDYSSNHPSGSIFRLHLPGADDDFPQDRPL